MPDYYLKFLGGSQVVAHFVMLSGVIHGTTFWGLSDLYDLGSAYGFSAAENAFLARSAHRAGSSWWDRASSRRWTPRTATATPNDAATCPYDGAAVDGVSYTSIATENDELVRPDNSDFIDPRCADAGDGIGVDNILVQHQCALDQADHLSIASDKTAAQDVLNALDPSQPGTVPCTLTLPAIG